MSRISGASDLAELCEEVAKNTQNTKFGIAHILELDCDVLLWREWRYSVPRALRQDGVRRRPAFGAQPGHLDC